MAAPQPSAIVIPAAYQQDDRRHGTTPAVLVKCHVAAYMLLSAFAYCGIHYISMWEVQTKDWNIVIGLLTSMT